MREFKLRISEDEEPTPRYMTINITRLAMQTGYSTSHLSRIFTKQTTPSLDCIRALAVVLKLKLDDLCQMIEEGRISATKTS